MTFTNISIPKIQAEQESLQKIKAHFYKLRVPLNPSSVKTVVEMINAHLGDELWIPAHTYNDVVSHVVNTVIEDLCTQYLGYW
ncbi:hypothetical protein CFF01_14440 [Shewanella marisflavi]|uniref:Uncharacterized protein n=1 Tax=Shewanella marisflavi TaxID=260364 RepID=A0AAC9TZC9_9GAMM|nr:hypothetical protein CFF01_14440 [Shewanella marisflavi]